MHKPFFDFSIRNFRSPKARSSRRNENSSSKARPKSKIEDVKNQRFSENVSNNGKRFTWVLDDFWFWLFLTKFC